jgi:hypothetical protein
LTLFLKRQCHDAIFEKCDFIRQIFVEKELKIMTPVSGGDDVLRLGRAHSVSGDGQRQPEHRHRRTLKRPGNQPPGANFFLFFMYKYF